MRPGARVVSRFVAWWSLHSPWARGEKPELLWRVEAWFLRVHA